MNLFKTAVILGFGSLMSVALYSCKNSDVKFPDYEGGVTAYFAYQYPVRTITLGEDLQQDNRIDNEHKCIIYATQGGAYDSKNLKINVAVDNTLVDGLTFEDGTPVKVMPTSHYSLESTTLTEKKDFFFGTTVTLNDAFFQDPDAIKNTYVIPLVMTDAVGADQILSGTPLIEGESPARCNSAAWSVLPKDYILYCVKYINPWHATYLRHGIDHVTEGTEKYDVVRHSQYVERDEVVGMTTSAYTKCIYPVSTTYAQGGTVNTITCDLELTFSAIDGDCNITIASATPGMTASGTGKFVVKGEKHSYNNQDHNAIYLNYDIDFGPKQFSSVDTLTVQSRNVIMEVFAPVYTKN